MWLTNTKLARKMRADIENCYRFRKPMCIVCRTHEEAFEHVIKYMKWGGWEHVYVGFNSN